MRLAISDAARNNLSQEELKVLMEAESEFDKLFARLHPVKKKFCTIVDNKELRIFSITVCRDDPSVCTKPIYTGKKYWFDVLLRNHPKWWQVQLIGFQLWY